LKNNTQTKLFNLEKKTVIITGSSGRLGSQYANILSMAGANVVLADIETKKNKQLEKILIKNFKTDPMTYDVDVSQKSEIEHMKNDVIKKYGTIDILINNAFFNPSQSNNSICPFEEFPLELWNEVLKVNLTGVFLCSQIIGNVMKNQKNGNIINIASIYGLVGADQRIYGNSKLNSPVSYAASKGAIVNLTRYLAAYWHGKNIRVNTLSLGGVYDESYMNKKFVKNYSNKTILGRMANNDEYNGAILFLASEASSYMTGANLVIDGGWTAW
jgi:NAD(P)-dependent dehydrogenase (short-subunit alcohol dehydrogenase family)